MAGLDPATHVLVAANTWIPGSSPGMTTIEWRDGRSHNCVL
jgi:hypothetical protein